MATGSGSLIADANIHMLNILLHPPQVLPTLQYQAVSSFIAKGKLLQGPQIGQRNFPLSVDILNLSWSLTSDQFRAATAPLKEGDMDLLGQSWDVLATCSCQSGTKSITEVRVQLFICICGRDGGRESKNIIKSISNGHYQNSLYSRRFNKCQIPCPQAILYFSFPFFFVLFLSTRMEISQLAQKNSFSPTPRIDIKIVHRVV